MGVRRVYDLEVEADHCYIANGVYVHNSNPNLQTIPSGSVFAKLIKQCFIAPVGFLFGGADFAALEDRISALTTRDPNKLKVYMGHIVYEVNINGTIHHIRDDATINFDGKSYTGEEFYDAFGSL